MRLPGILVLLSLTTLLGCGDSSRDDQTVSGESGPEGADPVWRIGPDLPQPITNNAVAAVEIDGVVSVFTFLGIDSTKVWSGATNVAYRWELGSDAWREIESVPGPGRLAATAQVVDGLIYVVGGYTVAEDGSERSVPDVNVLDPVTESWSRAADIPVPSDDAVSGVWRGNRIVLVSGWHDTGNIRDVQLYDPDTNIWHEASSIEGPPVFGHTGSVVGDALIYADGTRIVDSQPRFVIDSTSWIGAIDPRDPSIIEWESLAPHPGPPLYRAAAATLGAFALFIGGTDNPYNYDGIGYDGTPSRPLRQILGYSLETNAWSEFPPPPVATMDHRNAGVAGGQIFLVGGMVENQVVSDQIWYAAATDLLSGNQ